MRDLQTGGEELEVDTARLRALPSSHSQTRSMISRSDFVHIKLPDSDRQINIGDDFNYDDLVAEDEHAPERR